MAGRIVSSALEILDFASRGIQAEVLTGLFLALRRNLWNRAPIDGVPLTTPEIADISKDSQNRGPHEFLRRAVF
jgi:hypothetical protein